MEWLKKIRAEKSMTLAEVAEKAEISESYYCQIKNGRRGAPVATAKKIAAALGFEWQRFYEDPSESAGA